MSAQTSIFDNAKRKIQIEQTVRGFLQLLDENELDLEDGLVAWNMLGFTIFQDTYPEENHDEIQRRMAEFSKSLFDFNNNVFSFGLSLLGLMIVAYLHSLYKSEESYINRLSLILIIAGALGNILDRLPDGVVTDFLFFLSIFDFANTIGDAALASPAIKNLRLFICYLPSRLF